jgi:hypothetical protein
MLPAIAPTERHADKEALSAGIQIYRYNKLYLIFEFYDDPATAFWNNDVVRSVAKVLSDLEK